MTAVTVRYEGNGATKRTVVAAGERHGEVIAFWWGLSAGGRGAEQWSFLLPTERFLLSQPLWFSEQQRGWWYCDLVAVREEPDQVVIRDRYVDIVVGPPDHPYRVLDLDEHGAALASGALTPQQVTDDLACTQRFLDRRLNRRRSTERTWPDFPPACFAAFDPDTMPRQWHWT